MLRLFCACVALLTVVACSNRSPEERAAEAARGYYDRLMQGFPEDFLEGKSGVGELPSAYCDQLLQACRMYVADVKAKHGGVRQVVVSPNIARRDSIPKAGNGREGITYAFLLLLFNDSTQEEITVPMVEEDGLWRMK